MGWVSAVSLLLNENFVGRQAFDPCRALKFLSTAGTFEGKPFPLYARGNRCPSRHLCNRLAFGSEIVSAARWFPQLPAILRPSAFLKVSFNLQTAASGSAVPLEREIPFQFFPFCGLRHFDLPQLLASTRAIGLIVHPIDGDWNRMSETDARRLLPSRIRILSHDHPDKAVSEFLRSSLLTSVGRIVSRLVFAVIPWVLFI
jgi:hypothetical protein